MKKKAIIIVIIAMLLLGMLACLLCPRVVQLEECSEVYRRYEGLEGIDAAYIKNWISVLSNDISLVAVAAGRAEKAVQFILGNEE